MRERKRDRESIVVGVRDKTEPAPLKIVAAVVVDQQAHTPALAPVAEIGHHRVPLKYQTATLLRTADAKGAVKEVKETVNKPMLRGVPSLKPNRQ